MRNTPSHTYTVAAHQTPTTLAYLSSSCPIVSNLYHSDIHKLSPLPVYIYQRTMHRLCTIWDHKEWS